MVERWCSLVLVVTGFDTTFATDKPFTVCNFVAYCASKHVSRFRVERYGNCGDRGFRGKGGIIYEVGFGFPPKQAAKEVHANAPH